MGITIGQATKLNKSNRAAQDAALGTAIYNLQSGSHLGITSGSYLVTSSDSAGSSISIITSNPGAKGFITQEFRSGSPVFINRYATIDTGSLVITGGSASSPWAKITTADVVNWVAF
jgi:hypothetical protein